VAPLGGFCADPIRRRRMFLQSSLRRAAAALVKRPSPVRAGEPRDAAFPERVQ
jgi:hypothetical protein